MRNALITFMKRRSALFLILALAVGSVVSGPSSAADPSFEEIASAVVRVHSTIKPGARTARALGMERVGSGVLIDKDGLILTIGYLVMESSSVQITAQNGVTTQADFVAYDHRTGFGLVRARKSLDLRPMTFGSSSELDEGAPLLILSVGSQGGITPVRVVSRRPFAGYWEYLLDSAIFTMPPHREFGGAALIDLKGNLMGVGSLFVGDALKSNSESPGNMFVPIDLLKPILSAMVDTGRSGQKPRPWLGVHAAVSEGRVFINRVASGGPGAEAGLKAGDIIVGVKGRRVGGLEDLFRKVWSQGDAGANVTLDILPLGAKSLDIKQVVIRSRDRYGWLKMNH